MSDTLTRKKNSQASSGVTSGRNLCVSGLLLDWRWSAKTKCVQLNPHRALVKQSRSGQSLIEFAFILPILLLVMLGLIQFGVGAYTQNIITDAAQNGARVAADGDMTIYDGENTARTIIANNLGRNISQNAQIDGSLQGSNVEIEVRVTVPTFVPLLDSTIKFNLAAKAVRFKEGWIGS